MNISIFLNHKKSDINIRILNKKQALFCYCNHSFVSNTLEIALCFDLYTYASFHMCIKSLCMRIYLCDYFGMYMLPLPIDVTSIPQNVV